LTLKLSDLCNGVVEVLKYVRNTGIDVGILEYWNDGVVEYWKEKWSAGILDRKTEGWNTGMMVTQVEQL
jgi:hypothetical protein